jgi:hypothetical protein
MRLEFETGGSTALDGLWVRRWLIVLLAFLLIATGLVFAAAPRPALAAPGLTTQDLTGSLTANDLAQSLVGAGVTVSNVVYTGADVAAGTFAGGTGIIGFEDGIILTSGNVANVVGPNNVTDASWTNGLPGDLDLDTLAGQNTFDAAILEFDFTPNADTVSFEYVFASDEYNEFVGEINDVFAFYVNEVNCALVGGQPVSVNNINLTNNAGLYRNNDFQDGSAPIDTEMDGLTVVLTCEAGVTQGQTNTMKLAIADASDSILDSAVFIKAGSLTTTPPEEVIPCTGGGCASFEDPVGDPDWTATCNGCAGTVIIRDPGDDLADIEVTGSDPFTLVLKTTGKGSPPGQSFVFKDDSKMPKCTGKNPTNCVKIIRIAGAHTQYTVIVEDDPRFKFR